MGDRIKNAQLKHQIPLGALVELEDGVRLWVVEHARDCNQTPQYTLAAKKDEPLYSDDTKRFYSKAVLHGYPERSLVEVDNSAREDAAVLAVVRKYRDRLLSDICDSGVPYDLATDLTEALTREQL